MRQAQADPDALRSFNNVDLKTAAKYGIDVRRVPGYSPEAVAEHAMTLAMTVNRHMHKAYTK